MAITPGDLIGGHGNADKKFEDFMQRLLNHDDFDIDAYLCGHDHCKNHHIVTLPKKNKVVHAIVIGTEVNRITLKKNI